MTVQKKMTEGNVTSTIIRFAIPIMIGNIFQLFYNIVDTAVVGKGIGSEALAAVGTSSPVTQLLLGLMIGMTSGIAVVIAQHYGAGEKDKTSLSITNGIFLTMFITVVITCVGLLFSGTLFRLINTPESIIDTANRYTRILFIGTFATAMYNFEANTLRSFGNSVAPLVFLVISSICNIVLDLLFVMVFHLGVEGAAIATVLSQVISSLLCIVYIRKKVTEFHFDQSFWRVDKEMLRSQLKVGIPMAFFSSLLAISFLVLQSALNSLGPDDIAAYAAASKMDSIVYQILGAFGTAISTFCAQNYGSKNMTRVRQGIRVSLVMTVVTSLLLTVFIYLFGSQFMTIFVSADQTNIIQSGVFYMHITSLMYVVLGINFTVRFALTGVGKTIIPMMVGITEIITRAIVTYYLVYRIGFTGMAFASPACWVTSTLLCVICYFPMMKSAGVIIKKA